MVSSIVVFGKNVNVSVDSLPLETSDNTMLGGSIIAAGAVVLEGTKLEPGSLYAGVPAKFVKQVSKELREAEIERIAHNYVKYSGWFKTSG